MNSNNSLHLRKSIMSVLVFTTVISMFAFIGCDKNDDLGFSPEFSYTYNDDNHVQFTNESEGEYYSMIWDFGNGQNDTTTDKKKDYTIYYPAAGDFEVSLKLMNYSGDIESVVKTVPISNTDLLLSFTTEISPSNPNNVILKNTSQGDYESFKWLYRDLVVENEMEYEAYFPFEGNYDVELIVTKNNKDYSLIQPVNISQDDPNYVPNLTLVWSDEFDESSVNLDYWTFETGASGWGNNELQNYTNGDNSEIIDGKLIITAIKVDDNTTVGSYTSSRMVTRGNKEFLFGRMEIRAKLPAGRGIWPAIWMLGSNIGSVGWPACGEIDIMEYVGYQPDIVHATVHTTSGSGGNGDGSSMSLPTCEEEFHNYGMIWTEDALTFYIDSTDNIIHIYSPAVKTAENWPFDQSAFFILNIAVGGNWGGLEGIDNSIFPQSLEVDYVRVYQEVK